MIIALFLEGQKDDFDSFLQHLSQLEVGFLVGNPFFTPDTATGLKVSPLNTHIFGRCK